jgi:hypothetical protein
MKTRLVLFVALLAALLTPAAPAQAQEELPAQLKYIDAQLDVFIPLTQKYEDEYYQRHQQYYQALGSHEKAPATAEIASDLKARPTDQLADLGGLWDASGLPASINWRFRVDVATTPSGPGWQLVVQTTVKDVVWERIYSTIPGNKGTEWAEVRVGEI